ncbi:Hsp20/alpha crystallin family protein [Pelagicoccus albus]|uniref:Hsp20/alpha crystallin family protein n=1 Tax=Pelagicoccus albus TaxID=415222 RepID=A0A7X1B7W6_9BACT|nr:Hsp20/alpha crystallin family protein [Pelagicoccus albus]MBC2606043.1 Hsp20/alpha crystallin family protein [Pelagicoccus albus]
MTYFRTTTTPRYVFDWPAGLGDLEKQFETLFSGLAGKAPAKASSSVKTGPVAAKLRWYENESGYLARVDMPGVKKENLTIDIEEGILTVAGQRVFDGTGKAESETKKLEYKRELKVPENVDVEKISASYENGVLSMSLPLREALKPRQIKIG